MGLPPAEHLLWSKVQELKSKDFEELVCLPPYQEETARCNEGNVTLTVWREILAGGEVRILVQVNKVWMLGVGWLRAAGFRMTPDGQINDLEGDELSEVM